MLEQWSTALEFGEVTVTGFEEIWKTWFADLQSEMFQ